MERLATSRIIYEKTSLHMVSQPWFSVLHHSVCIRVGKISRLIALGFFFVLFLSGNLKRTHLSFSWKNQELSHGTIRIKARNNTIDSNQVQWVHDEKWFQKRSERGCCPYAELLYHNRYAGIDNRCCTATRSEIEPLRPIGGIQSWSLIPVNTTILLQGDSLAEQHFLSLLCFDWDDDDANNPGDRDKYLSWTVEGKRRNWKATHKTRNIRLEYWRWNHASICPKEHCTTLDYSEPDFVIVGGWHHSRVDQMLVETMVDAIQTRRNRKSPASLVVTQALAAHFPGGEYRPTNTSPTALHSPAYETRDKPSLACDMSSTATGYPDINTDLVHWVGGSSNHTTNPTLLNVARLYQHRGDAHIGSTSSSSSPKDTRDCLHWCVAPGVLDALAFTTLSAIVNASDTHSTNFPA